MISKKIGDTYYDVTELAHLNYDRNIKKIDKVLVQTLKRMGIYDHIVAAKIEKIWKNLVGEHAAQYTAEIQVIKNRLYVKITSAAMRQDLMMYKTQLLEAIKAKTGIELEEIVIF